LGPGYRAREKEALQLLKEGYAEYLLIPSFYYAYKYQGGELQPQPLGRKDIFPNYPTCDRPVGFLAILKRHESNRIRDFNNYPDHREETHIEICRARQMAEMIGTNKFLLVSSPYHMRRIKLIAQRVFASGPDAASTSLGSKFELYFIPTRYESGPEVLWFLKPGEWKLVFLESLKIIWFSIYSFFHL
jgi:hypothetical protein